MSEIARGGRWSESPVAHLPGTDRLSAATGRSSSTLLATELGPWFQEQLRLIESALEALGVELPNLEPWQVTRYLCGEAYDYHLDCGCWGDHPSGERKRTIMLYLQEPQSGGATHFRALNQTIEALAGRLLAWYNLLPNGNCNHAMIHSSLPVRRGCKMILTTWEHQTRFVHHRR
jgi:prolyl 4-hydroxylase